MGVSLTYLVQQIVDKALLKIGVSEPDAMQRESALDSLNQLIAVTVTDQDLWIQGIAPVGGFENLSDTFDAPQEYANYFIYNLAMALASEYGVKAPDVVIALAQGAAALIKRQTYLQANRRIPSNSITL